MTTKRQEILNNRVKKARETRFTPLPGVRGAFGVWGSQNDYYQVRLSRLETLVTIGDKDIPIIAIVGQCNKYHGVGIQEACKGNERTVCYHCLGAIIEAFKSQNKSVAFFEDIVEALCYQRLGGKLVKIQGEKVFWGIVKDKPAKVAPDNDKVQISPQEAIKLMRGDEGSDQID